MMYYQNDETGVLEALEIKPFCPNHDGQTFRELFKNYFHGFYILVMTSLKFSRKKRYKCSKFIARGLKIIANKKLQKRAI